MTPLSKITNPEQTRQFQLTEDHPSSNTINALLLNNTVPVTLYNSLLLFRETDKEFELE